MSVVIPVYNVAPYLAECLDSLLAQTQKKLEVVLVDDGSTDGSSEIARRYAREHANIRYHRQANQGLSAARNAGARQARGEYLAFFDSDDFMDPAMYRTMVRRLEETGSDFAVCGYERFVGGRFVPPGNWIVDAHEHRRDATDSTASPDLLVSVIAVNKVFRREFWDKHRVAFPLGRFYEDQVVAMKVYALASSFDVLPQRFVKWRAREEGGSITQHVLDPTDLAHQVAAWDDAIALAESLGREDLARARRQQLLRNDIPRILSEESKAPDDAYLDAVAAVAERYLDDLGPEGWSAVRIQHRLILKVLLDSRASYRSYVETMGFGISTVPILPTPGGLPQADLDRLARELLPIDLEDAAISPSQARPVVRVSQIVRRGTAFELRGWAYLANFDTVVYPTALTLRLVQDGSGAVLPLAHEAVEAPEANLHARSASCDFRRSGFVATVDLAEVPGEGIWRVEADVAQGGLERTARAHLVNRHDDALPSSVNAHDRRFTLVSHPHDGIALEVTQRRVVPVRIEQAPCRVAFPTAGTARPLAFTDLATGTTIVSEPVEAPGGTRYVEAPAPAAFARPDTGPKDIEVRFVADDGTPAGPVAWPVEAPVVPAAHDVAVLRPSKRGNVKLVLQDRCFEVDAIDLDGSTLVLGGVAVLAPRGARWTVRLEGEGHESHVHVSVPSPGALEVRVPVENGGGAHAAVPLPAGRYDVHVFDQDGAVVPVRLAPWRAEPVEDRHGTADWGLRVLRVRSSVTFTVEAPKAEGAG
ncbi:glycosyltransferase involved in cell wall biosynthesis [Flavimobilis soli]|uniref:Glycosyltransferase involved in cell wall biosynthesis n=1 Tax=Flavimobilis soli TaxID=442709 RepID=A0A2A9EH83_9MICO|nr:glycosyltransferase family 2 protein [Flavimobilis soli]PFG37609.1 glycosyltransferase involved in cell wall biosynthesis [Flavimobilis soli]